MLARHAIALVLTDKLAVVHSSHLPTALAIVLVDTQGAHMRLILLESELGHALRLIEVVDEGSTHLIAPRHENSRLVLRQSLI